MAENLSSRGNAFYLMAANLIVVIGVVAFAYVGEQITRGDRTSTAALVVSRTTALSPISAAGFVEQR